MSTATIPAPSSPGVGARRKGPKSLPKLPLSAFSPPNSGTSDSFGLTASPSTVHPESVIDGHVVISNGGSLDQWRKEAGEVLGIRVSGVVVDVRAGNLTKVITELESKEGTPDVLSVSIPFELDGPTETVPSTSLPLSFVTTYTGPAPQGATKLRQVLERGRPVEIFIQDLQKDVDLEGLEELLDKSTTDLPNVPAIILSNFVPPPHDSTLPIVKLMHHPKYQSFQTQTAALSLYANVSVKLLPPSWVSTPEGDVDDAIKQKKEWKRRIKMYLAPIVEAFGYQRIIFGSSPSPTTKTSSIAADWYELARESLAELGVEQEFIDAVFHDNAKRVYGF